MDEMPTVAVKSLGQGTCDECYHGFVVMNRPWALLQFTQSRAYVEIEEQFIFVMETVMFISANNLGAGHTDGLSTWQGVHLVSSAELIRGNHSLHD